MLVIGLGFIWFLSHAQAKITKSKLKEQELDMYYQKRMLVNTVKTKENERNRIAKELHDDVSSQLGIINFNLYALKKRIPHDDKVSLLMDQISSSLKSSTERTRSISHELMPLMFRKYGIHETLKELTANINLTGEIELTIIDDFLIKISDEFKLLHIYRIVQELTNNTLKYAKASKIGIYFVAKENDLTMTYIDDGRGINPNKMTYGLGLSNIKTRVSLLEGNITIESSENKGFKAIIKFPNYD
ncbi:MAG: two-component system NarL family sensor kinase [Saprospiraceae bacterium]|jgi:two-component system NarL family sensor kinase